ncbi:MAG TPA: 3-hydroxyacyl-CoA dehydrogenase NAD-binding domain-containing protein [candidate division Zixibacteria bacterium]|nr:3-hydroxyacyl-CoA dehydrogenase NAD-binding domain-containing protein [candidate division Zixibacteria bacterium]
MKSLRRAAVLGAGVMGSQLAALLAGSGLKVELFDIPGPDPNEPQGIAKQALKKLKTQKPSPLFHPSHLDNIRPGSLEHHLDRLKGVEWVLEAAPENLKIKHELFAKISGFLSDDCMLSSNTSSLSVSKLAETLPEEFRKRFFITHFFNPPRYLRLLELLPHPQADVKANSAFLWFLDRHLGKSIVEVKDTPAFIANRVGIFALLDALALAAEFKFSPSQIDFLTGPLIGRQKSATCRTADLVGLDTVMAVVKIVREGAPDDPRFDRFTPPPILQALVSTGKLGVKTGTGFYRRERDEIEEVDENLNYVKRKKLESPLLAQANAEEDLIKRVRMLFAAPGDPAGAFVSRHLISVANYAAALAGKICDRPGQIDDALRWGFGWQMGPLELAKAAGCDHINIAVSKFSIPAPALPEKIESGEPGPVLLPAQAEKIVAQNKEATLLDAGNGIAVLAFHSKLNVIGAGILNLSQQALERVKTNFDALVIANDPQVETFSAGANLAWLLMAASEGDFDEIALMIKKFQAVTEGMASAPFPVVAAPFGLTLGGGCEICLAATRRVAHRELYIGLVETGVGLLPAGGGTTRMAEKVAQWAKSGMLLPHLKTVFENVGLAKVSMSADEAFAMGYLQPEDLVVPNRGRLTATALSQARLLADAGTGSKPPEKIRVAGKNGLAAVETFLYLMRESKMITGHDATVGRSLARVLCGGELPGEPEVPREYLLQLEAEEFLRLVGMYKTQERMAHLLKTGKPLRN